MSANVTFPLGHGSRKAKWTHEEDENLRNAILMYGTDSWNRVAMCIPSRTGKQCRERWIGQLAPTVSKETWLPEEDALLFQLHATAGNRWTTLALSLPGRTALSIKNRWHWLMRHTSPRASPEENLPSRFDVVEHSKPCHIVFEPLKLDDRPFGAAFEKFRMKMMMGIDFTWN
jgi:hypothetical protein